MTSYIYTVLQELLAYTRHMGPRQWAVVLVLVVVVGFTCMRGFGSRNGY